MQTTINTRTLKAISRAMSTEETRYYLCGVLVDASADHVTYVATQGHVLLARRESIANGGEPITGPFIGSLIIPAAIVAGFKITKRDDGCALLSTEDGKEFTINFGGDKRTFTPIDGTFPDWQRAIPQTCEHKTPAQFDARYMTVLAKASEDLGLGGKPDVFHNGNEPALVTFGDENTLGVIMPFKGPKPGAVATAPAWASSQPVTTALAG